jgi:hypothetical protein
LHQASVGRGHPQSPRTAAVAASNGSRPSPSLKAGVVGTDSSGRSGSWIHPCVKLLGWLTQAGFSGLKLACQLLCLAVALMIGRVVARIKVSARALWSTSA